MVEWYTLVSPSCLVFTTGVTLYNNWLTYYSDVMAATCLVWPSKFVESDMLILTFHLFTFYV